MVSDDSSLAERTHSLDRLVAAVCLRNITEVVKFGSSYVLATFKYSYTAQERTVQRESKLITDSHAHVSDREVGIEVVLSTLGNDEAFDQFQLITAKGDKRGDGNLISNLKVLDLSRQQGELVSFLGADLLHQGVMARLALFNGKLRLYGEIERLSGSRELFLGERVRFGPTECGREKEQMSGLVGLAKDMPTDTTYR